MDQRVTAVPRWDKIALPRGGVEFNLLYFKVIIAISRLKF
jgi:hypothetical protein